MHGLFDKRVGASEVLAVVIGGNAESLKQRLQKEGIDATQRNSDNVSPILQAAKDRRWDLVLILAKYFIKNKVSNKANILQYDEVIKLAREGNQDDIIKQLEPFNEPRKEWSDLSNSELKSLITDNPFLQNEKVNGRPLIEYYANSKKWDHVVAIINHGQINKSEALLPQYQITASLAIQEQKIWVVEALNEKTGVPPFNVEEFRKIYNALHEGQFSIKSPNRWVDNKSMNTNAYTNMEINAETVLKYAAKHPNSRTARAVEFTQDYLTNGSRTRLIAKIYKYAHRITLSEVFDFSDTELAVNRNVQRQYIDDAYLKAKSNSCLGKIKHALGDDDITEKELHLENDQRENKNRYFSLK